jgi:hypothetical protein
MATSRSNDRWRTLLDLFLIVAAAGLLFPAAAAAQARENKPVDLPNGPSSPGFDITRFSNAGNGAAMFVNAKSASVDGKDVRLDDGSVVRLGMLLGRDGKPAKTDRPQQIFTRWYGLG